MPGVFTISSPKLAFTRIHMVSRQGMVYRPVAGTPTPGTREYQHDSSAGTLTFGVPGYPLGTRDDPEPRELVQVTFEE